MSQTNKDIALKFLHSLCAGDVATLKTVVTDDVVAIVPGTSQIAGTRHYDEIMAVCAMFPQISKDGLSPRVLHVTAEEDRVSIEWEGSCKLVNGQQYNNCYHMLLFIRDGKVCRLKEYLDTKMADSILIPLMANLAG
jgi:ketosteroid isomerase-like protein